MISCMDQCKCFIYPELQGNSLCPAAEVFRIKNIEPDEAGEEFSTYLLYFADVAKVSAIGPLERMSMKSSGEHRVMRNWLC